jgi:hypothetical protein
MRIVISSSTLVGSLAVAGTVSAHPIDEIEPGHWAEVSLNTIEDVDPCPASDCSYSAVEGISGVIDDWNGGAFATGWGTLGGLVVWGGGHNGYFGSEVYVFDLESQLWVRASEPYDNGAGSVAGDCSDEGVYPDGSACPAHTYDRVDYHPATNRFVIISGTNDPVCGGCDDGRVHLFDLDDATWALGPAVPNANALTGAMSAYDGTRDVFWFLGTYGVPPLKRLDPAGDGGAGAWSEHGSPAQPLEIDGAAIHDPDHDLLLHVDPLGTQGLFAFDLADPDAPGLPLTTAGDTEILSADKVGFEWDPVEGRAVLWDDGADVYVLEAPADPLGGTWTITRWPAAETNTVVPERGVNGTYSRFRYAPSVNAFVLVSHVDGPVWAYRFNDRPGRGPNEPPGDDTGADDTGGGTASGDGTGAGASEDGGQEGGNADGTTAASAGASGDGTAGDAGAADDAAVCPESSDCAESCSCRTDTPSRGTLLLGVVLAMASRRRHRR